MLNKTRFIFFVLFCFQLKFQIFIQNSRQYFIHNIFIVRKDFNLLPVRPRSISGYYLIQMLNYK